MIQRGDIKRDYTLSGEKDWIEVRVKALIYQRKNNHRGSCQPGEYQIRRLIEQNMVAPHSSAMGIWSCMTSLLWVWTLHARRAWSPYIWFSGVLLFLTSDSSRNFLIILCSKILCICFSLKTSKTEFWFHTLLWSERLHLPPPPPNSRVGILTLSVMELEGGVLGGD